MNCEDAIEYIHSLEKFGIKPGLERISLLCEKLGNPQNNLKFIHIAGTNGKGSTSTITASILKHAGYNVGLYTSPYVIDFRERIQINGEMISPKDLAECVYNVKCTAEKYSIETTEFEFITATAFLFFEKMKCDYVVLEVGLGGRFDATNIIPSPIVAGIVNISLDHTAILGNTVSEIAYEKSGIIKKGCKVVSYPLQSKEALNIILDKCGELDCKLISPDLDKLRVIGCGLSSSVAEYSDIHFELFLPGRHMIYNAITAIEIIKALGIDISDEIISKGIYDTVMPARIEIMQKNPIVLIDGGHNEDCASALRKYIESFLASKRIIMVTSIMADKDYVDYIKLVVPFADLFIATQAVVSRALDSAVLKSEASAFCSNCIEIKNSSDAVDYALKEAGDDDVVLICGSFYLAGEIRNKFKIGVNKNDKND